MWGWGVARETFEGWEASITVSCVTLGKLLALSGPLFLQLGNEEGRLCTRTLTASGGLQHPGASSPGSSLV